MIFEIRPIDVKKWHGVSGEKNFSMPIVVPAKVNSDTNKYETGLSEDDISFLEKSGIKYDLSDDFVLGKPHPFWDASVSMIKLPNVPIFLDDKKPLDLIKIRIMQASERVCPNIEAVRSGDYPKATHFIFSEIEEVSAKANRIETKNNLRRMVFEMSFTQKVNVLAIINKIDYSDKSESFVTVKIDEVIESNTSVLLGILNDNKEIVNTKALVIKALYKSILNRDGVVIKYNGTAIGVSVDDVVRYLNKIENQTFKLRLISSVDGPDKANEQISLSDEIEKSLKDIKPKEVEVTSEEDVKKDDEFNEAIPKTDSEDSQVEE